MEAEWSKEPERNKGRGGRKGGGKTPEIQIQMKYNANTNTKGELGGNMMRYRGSGGRRCVAGVGWVA